MHNRRQCLVGQLAALGAVSHNRFRSAGDAEKAEAALRVSFHCSAPRKSSATDLCNTQITQVLFFDFSIFATPRQPCAATLVGSAPKRLTCLARLIGRFKR